MINCLMVGLGGFFGSILRYLMGFIPIKQAAGFKTGSFVVSDFPFNTMLINIIGAFAIGAVISVFSRNSEMNPHLLLLLKVGFCGGFTTFSTFSAETLSLIESGSWFAASLYAVLSVTVCVFAVFLGQYFFR